MPISSYVIHCAPADQAELRRQLRTLPGVEAGEGTSTGVPVVADTPTTRAAAELGEQLQKLPGVKSAILVYHNFEDEVTDRAAPSPPSH